ncbi:hypothetical protein AMS68_006903 [Peltaster fructicola]|uniref:Serine/threonine-protein phosphatase 2A activator n=1 Tax=Peltaster fructicola TaxID=286661 RepID=A0A6H0Y359_9PEZI|nr:hypothetical protein AMS68_006903 [Peltaster fructicola]
MSILSASPTASDPYLLQHLSSEQNNFIRPTKQINSGDDLTFFLTSTAYRDLKIWISQLSRACLPHRLEGANVETHQLDVPEQYTTAVKAVKDLLAALSGLIEQAPPDTGPRRFGNVAFRSWVALLNEHIDQLLDSHLRSVIPASRHSVLVELKVYILESFGSAQRLDYGTGHELSFLAFLGGLWKLGVFSQDDQWQIVAGAVNPYLELVRTLIKTYTLEPAGSHGVWGLDDHFFIPFILGSAQLATPLPQPTEKAPYPRTPIEGSLDSAPEPASITSQATVSEQRPKNFYFAAIGFIFDVKKGPFFEHSPYLYNISGIKDGWGKINKGMLKMYDAEVLAKFPVVQHFPFGQLWQWERDPQAVMSQSSIHVDNQPTATSKEHTSTRAPWSGSTDSAMPSTRSPAASSIGTAMPSTKAPWARNNPAMLPTRAPSGAPGTMPPPRNPRDR